jgi:hypothetical protein
MSEFRGGTPVTVLPELERMLVEQASRHVVAVAAPVTVLPLPEIAPPSRPVRRRGRISRRSIALALLVALVVGSAVAAVHPWSPLLGNERGGHPTVSQKPPGKDALRLLGVLRRAQTDADRDAQTAAALRIVGPPLHGVKVQWIRNLEANVAGMAVTLVPVDAYGDVGEVNTAADGEGFLCMLYPSSRPAPGISLHCWSPAEIASGRAVAAASSEGVVHVFGLVPDGVVSVSIVLADGRDRTVEVRANFFDAAEPAGFARLPSVTWQDAEGRRVGPPADAAPGHEQSAR